MIDAGTLAHLLDGTAQAVDAFELPPDPFIDGDLFAAAVRCRDALVHLTDELNERRRIRAQWAEHDARLAIFDPGNMPPPPPPPPPPPKPAQPKPPPPPPPPARPGK